MFVAPRNKRLEWAAAGLLPKAISVKESANASERYAKRLASDEFFRRRPIYGQNQLKVLTVRERMVQRREAISIFTR